MSKILFFTNSKTCNACKVMKDKIKENNIEHLFSVHDIATDDKAQELATKYIVRSLPTFIREDFVGPQYTGTTSIDSLIALSVL